MTEIRIIVPGPPPRKNARGTIVNGRRITPKKTREWYDRLQEAMAERLAGDYRKAMSGRWAVEIHVHEDKLRHLDVDVPHGDIDSTITAILDGLQRKPWNVLDDDARIVAAHVRKYYDKDRPRVEIALMRVP